MNLRARQGPWEGLKTRNTRGGGSDAIIILKIRT